MEIESDEILDNACQMETQFEADRVSEPSKICQKYARSRLKKDLAELKDREQFLPHAIYYMKRNGTICGTRMPIYYRDDNILESFVLQVIPRRNESDCFDKKYNFWVHIPDRFPFRKPIVTAIVDSSFYRHPNICPVTGDVGIKILKQEWTPVITLRSIVLAIVLLFVDPATEHDLLLDPTFGRTKKEIRPNIVKAFPPRFKENRFQNGKFTTLLEKRVREQIQEISLSDTRSSKKYKIT